MLTTRSLSAPAIRATVPDRHPEFCGTTCMYAGSPRGTCEGACHANAMLGRSKATTASRGAARPAAKRTTISPVDVYRHRNGGVHAALPEGRSSLCEATCFGGVEVCDGETACWSKRLEEKGAAMRGGTLNVTAIYRERNGQPAAAPGPLNVAEVYGGMNAAHHRVRGHTVPK